MEVMRPVLAVLAAAVLGWPAGCGDGDGDATPGADAGDPTADAGSEPGIESDPFYDPASIVDVRLTVAANDLAVLDADPFARVYVPGTFESMGVTLDNVGVRYKGNSSLARAGNKPSFKVKINEYASAQRFLGLTKVNLNNTVLDPSMQREMLAYELFRDFGLPASRANYARLYVNGEYYGLYVNVEQVDKRMLARTFGDNDGNLYKQYAGASLEYRGSNAAVYDDGTYRKKTNETENDWTDLLALCELLATDDLAALEAQLPTLFDTSSFLRWLAANTYLGHIDAYTGFANNFYLYRDPATEAFVYIPWDLDITFGTAGHGGTTTDFLLNWDLYDPQIPSPTGPRPLLTKLMAIAGFRAEYTGYLVELLDGGALQARLDLRIDAVRALIGADARADTRKPYSDADFDRSLTEPVLATGDTVGPPVIGIRTFVDQRTPIVAAELP